MVHLGLAILTYSFAVIQTTIPHELGQVDKVPQLMAVVVAVSIIFVDGWPLIAWAALAGLIADGLSSQPLGIEMTAAVLVAFSVRWMLENRRVKSVFLNSIIAAAAAFAIVVVSNSIRVLLSGVPMPIGHTIVELAISAGVSALIALFLVICCGALKRLTSSIGRNRFAEPARWSRIT